MTSVTGILSVLLAISTTAECLRCHKCHVRHAEVCDGPLSECPASATSCMAISEIFEMGSSRIHSYALACNVGGECKPFITTTSETTKRSNIQCCTQDGCNSNLTFYVPPKPTEYKGKMCPTCFTYVQTGCDPKGSTIQCFEPEDKCFDYRGSSMGPGNATRPYSLKGCMSPVPCLEEDEFLYGWNSNQLNFFDCSTDN